jgi:hypothetical protein
VGMDFDQKLATLLEHLGLDVPSQMTARDD